jgi:septal ring factor EnvC (AmiA/AmiB activator)
MLQCTCRQPLLCLVFALILAGGCAPKTQGEKTVLSYMKTRETLDEARRQVALTQASLANLRTQPPDLKEAFGRYRDAVSKLEKEGADAKQRSEAMKERSDDHIAAWRAEMKTIKDPAIKASSESRQGAVRSNFTLIQMYAQDARKAYEPFLRGNKDMVQALSIDLSPAGISSLAPSIDRVIGDGKALDNKLWMMQQALDNIANGQSPLGDMR